MTTHDTSRKTIMTAIRDRVRERTGLRDWIGLGVLAAALLAAPAVLTDFRLDLLGKYLCYAIVAIGIGLAWGKGGMLVLGQGVYFGIGGYAMAMHLKLSDAGPGQAPDFMQLYGDGQLPWWWEPFRNPVATMIAIVAVPSLLAAVLGYATFYRKVRGAYFAILSQALAAAFAIFLIGNQVSTGGTNGLTNFRSFFGYDLYDPANKVMLYLIAVAVLLLAMIGYRQLTVSRYGELLVACRDAEGRIEFLGYSPAAIKTAGYIVAALLAAVGGALFVPIVGIISPADVGVVPSVGLLIGVAIGGRNTLFGPVLGAIVVAWAATSLSEQFPSAWTYAQGLMFMIVIAFLPGGMASIGKVTGRLRALSLSKRRPASTGSAGEIESAKREIESGVG